MNSEREPDISLTSINCVRGRVASAIAHLIWVRPDAVERLLPIAEQLLADPHPAVRYEALSACIPMLRHNKERAVQMAVDACDHPDDRLLGSRWLNRIISASRTSHLKQLGPVIERMAKSEVPSVAESGAAWATACWLDKGELATVVEECRVGRESQRMGVAEVACEYFAKGLAINTSETLLIEFFGDPSKKVRDGAAVVFRYEGVFDLNRTPELSAAFVASPAFLDDASHLLSP
ncbi:MAG: hypothetical protein IID42_01950, partial [Planctomycetes bacterium]|nr:hypothetical protein [Planctomycetota bacterium]